LRALDHGGAAASDDEARRRLPTSSSLTGSPCLRGGLRQRIINADKEPTYGLHRKKQMPFFRMLKKEIFGDTELDEDGISSLVSLTQQVFIELESELKLAGFWESIPARNKLRADIQKTLLQREFSKLPGLVRCIPIKRRNASWKRTVSDIRMSR
jgi:hypothetical protein